MTRFVNKRELVIIVLLILVFDLNGFCDIVTSMIPYKKKVNFFTYLLAIAFFLFDVFVFHYVVNFEPEDDVAFAVEDNEETKKKGNKVEQDKKINVEETIAKDESMFSLVEKVVINFLALVVTLVIIATLYFVGSKNSDRINSVKYVTVLLSPLLLVVSSLLSFANIYLN